MRHPLLTPAIVGLLISSACLGCGHAPARSEPRREDVEAALDAEDGVFSFESVPFGFHTRSYWIEGPDGVVVIDTQFMPSEAERLLRTIAAHTDAPVRLAIVLHANPDKFNGTAVFRAHGIPVVSSSQVLSYVPHVHEIRTRAFRDRYAPDYPEAPPPLESFGDVSRTLEVAGLSLGLHVMGAGCSEAHVVVTHGRHAFVGDLVAPGGHAWLELGHLTPWHARLDEIAALAPARIHPGRGRSGGPELLAAQHQYLTTVATLTETVQRERGESATEESLAELRARIEAAFPGFSYPIFLRIGAPAVWASVAAGR